MAATKEWHQADYFRRRTQAIEYLGGKCARCGNPDDLEFDHTDSTKKEFNIARNLNRRWEVLAAELDKCQLLCPPCHIAKTRENGDHVGGHNRWTEIEHGKAWAYIKYKCRCDLCVAANAQAKGRPIPTRKYNSATHGSKTMYSYHKCRCDICKTAHTERQKKYRNKPA